MLFAILAILSFALQNTCCKEYGNRYPNTVYAQAVMIFVSLSVVAAIMAAMGGAQPLTPRGYLLALAFGVAFVVTLAGMTIAMNSGHMGITLLIQNSSLLIPTVFGVLVWHEKLTPVKVLGIALILALLGLSAGDGEAAAGNVKNWNRRRWIIVTAVAFLGDGVLAILQGMMSRECATTSSVNFTFWTSVFSVAVSALLIAFYRLRGQRLRMIGDRRELAVFSGLCAGIGVGTAGGNCFSILAPTRLSSVVFFPLRQGGLVLVMWVVGVLLYREKVSRRGLIMLAVGLLGLVLLNLG